MAIKILLMNSWKPKVLGALLLIAATIAATFGSCGKPTTSTPSSVNKRTIDSLINVHGSDRRDIEICGQTFKAVSKYGLGYARVPDSNYILFVYRKSPQKRTVVVVNTNNCDIIEIPLEGVRFRGDFRSQQSPTQKIADYIEGFSSNQVFLVSKTLAYFERSVVDLDRRTIRVTELDVFDHRVNFGTLTNQGAEINQTVSPNR